MQIGLVMVATQRVLPEATANLRVAHDQPRIDAGAEITSYNSIG